MNKSLFLLASAAFTMFGIAASSALAAPVVTYLDGPDGTFTVSSTDLINQGTSTFSSSSFTGTDSYGTGVGSLNDGVVAPYGPDDTRGSLTPTAGSVATFFLDTSTNTGGYTLSSIVSLTDFETSRSGQAYTVAYTTVTDPTFTTLATVSIGYDDTEQQATITLGATDAVGVNALQFTFALDPSTGLEDVYREIDVSGTATTVPEPASLGLLSIGGLALLRRRARRA